MILNVVQIAQIIGKPDLAPAAWVKRLVTLCDRAPPTPFDVVKLVLENELGQGINDVFDRFDVEPLGSASIAQVHVKLLTCYLIFLFIIALPLGNGCHLNCTSILLSSTSSVYACLH